MNVLGIDPGLSGAIAMIDERGSLARLIDMPTTMMRGKQRIDGHALAEFFDIVGDDIDHVVLEDVGSRPGMGATSAFTFGHGYGVLQGLLIAHCFAWSLVAPARWTKLLAVGSDKGYHRVTAMHHFPNDAASFRRAKDDGRADAALLSLYGLRHVMGVAS